MRGIYVISYIPNSSYTREKKGFKRKGLWFRFYVALAKLKGYKVEVVEL